MRILTRRIYLIALMMTATLSTNASVESDRKEIQDMRDQALTKLYKEKKGSKNLLENAPGYAVFKNASVTIVFASLGDGYGLVHDNTSGKETYMKMAEVGVGLGIGAKDYRLIFVFHHADTMNDFIKNGWDFGAQTDATAKAGKDGGAASADARMREVTVYSLTATGLSIQGTLNGTKYWQDDNLN